MPMGAAEKQLDGAGSDIVDDDSESTLGDSDFITWFCNTKGHEFFCKVEREYIEDNFNLFGLRQHIPNYSDALAEILDRDWIQEEYDDDYIEEVYESAATLYGMIHARYLLTSVGLQNVRRKFVNYDYGTCPRALCEYQACLPIGISDIMKQSSVKVFCPRCKEVYHPTSKHSKNIDGAYFGTTMAHLFQLEFPDCVQHPQVNRYVPRIYGFKLRVEADSSTSSKRQPTPTPNAAAATVGSSSKSQKAQK